MAGSDFGRLARTYGLTKVDIDLPTANDNLIVAKGPLRIVTVLYIAFFPSTYSGTTLTFSDSVTGVVIGVLTIPAAAPQTGNGNGFIDIDYGPNGTPLSPGATLVLGGTGAGRLHIDAYQKGQPLQNLTPGHNPAVSGYATNG